ncbi:hypothetical protein B0H63DRAFT_445740 [Podospora didyma]|uniref:Uncharacterized protein n=1 Tax=Podospora didyma TaxID=330526 RepID=A0AAE0NXP9_9PEZI|nr:hypothetical protein B0H63DRAFT_445740 [Podospora didyma]
MGVKHDDWNSEIFAQPYPFLAWSQDSIAALASAVHSTVLDTKPSRACKRFVDLDRPSSAENSDKFLTTLLVEGRCDVLDCILSTRAVFDHFFVLGSPVSTPHKAICQRLLCLATSIRLGHVPAAKHFLQAHTSEDALDIWDPLRGAIAHSRVEILAPKILEFGYKSPIADDIVQTLCDEGVCSVDLLDYAAQHNLRHVVARISEERKDIGAQYNLLYSIKTRDEFVVRALLERGVWEEHAVSAAADTRDHAVCSLLVHHLNAMGFKGVWDYLATDPHARWERISDDGKSFLHAEYDYNVDDREGLTWMVTTRTTRQPVYVHHGSMFIMDLCSSWIYVHHGSMFIMDLCQGNSTKPTSTKPTSTKPTSDLLESPQDGAPKAFSGSRKPCCNRKGWLELGFHLKTLCSTLRCIPNREFTTDWATIKRYGGVESAPYSI